MQKVLLIFVLLLVTSAAPAAIIYPLSWMEFKEGNVSKGEGTIIDFGDGFDVSLDADEAEIVLDLAEIATYNNTEWDTAYTHSQDNTQAHTDYLINNGDDTTSGKIGMTNLDLTANPSAIASANPIDIKPSGDTDDYIRLKTVADILYLEIMGGTIIGLESNTANTVQLLCVEDNFNIRGDDIHIMAGDDADDYIKIDTVADEPEIGTMGGCNLKLTASGDKVFIPSGKALTVDSPTLVVNVPGYTDKVGIGTATPATALDVDGTITATSGTFGYVETPTKGGWSTVITAADSPTAWKYIADIECTGNFDEGLITPALATVSAAGGGKVLLGPGTFDIENGGAGSIGITVPSDVELWGCGDATELKRGSTVAADLQIINIPAAATNVGIFNLKVSGDGHASGSVGVYINNDANDIHIENVSLVDLGDYDAAKNEGCDGIFCELIDGYGPKNLKIINCRGDKICDDFLDINMAQDVVIDGCYGKDIKDNGVDTEGGDSVKVVNSTFDNCDGHGVEAEDGSAGTIDEQSRTLISNCIFKNCGDASADYGVWINSGVKTIVIGCEFYNCQNGVGLDKHTSGNAPTYNKVTNCIFDTIASEGIEELDATCDYNEFLNNTFINVSGTEIVRLGAHTLVPHRLFDPVDIRTSSLPMTQVRYHDTDSSGAGLTIAKAGGTFDSPTVVADGERIASIIFQGYSAAASAFRQCASILVQIDGNPDDDSTDMPGEFLFQTSADGSSIPATRMTIGADGTTTFNGNVSSTGTLTLGGNLIIPDAGYIGSVSDTDAIQIEADGDIVITQDLAVQGESKGSTLRSSLIGGGAATDVAVGINNVNNTGMYGFATTGLGLSVKGTSVAYSTDTLWTFPVPVALPNVTGDTAFSGDIDCDELIMTHGLQDYKFTKGGGDYDSAIISQTSGKQNRFELYTADGDGTDRVQFNLYGYGTPTAFDPRHLVIFGWDKNAGYYKISTAAVNVLNRDLVLSALGKSVRILTGTDFKVEDKLRIGSTVAPAVALDVTGAASIGDATNHLAVSNAGVVTMAGTAKRVLSVRPDFDFSKITALGKPTLVVLGAHTGFSLPLYAADEELFFAINVPGRWDGASDVNVHILAALSAAETAEDDFNLQLSWRNSREGSDPATSVVLDNTTHDVEVETNIVDARKAQYNTFLIDFVIDYNVDVTILAHDLLSMRLRRIAAVGTEIAGEIIVLDVHVDFVIDKMAEAP